MIYFDNAATSFPKPPEVADAVSECIKLYSANPGRSGHRLSLIAAEEVFKCREAAGNLFGCSPENVIFTLNATMALNFAIKGAVSPNEKVHILISDLEHNSVYRPVAKLAELGHSFSVYSTTGTDDDILRSIKSKLRKKTGIIIATHASNVTGEILPVEKIGKFAAEHGLFYIIDASQTAGKLPLDLKATKAGCICTAGHKGLYGPMGTGLLILGNDVSLDTVFEGGTGTLSFDKRQPDFSPERYESGTVNLPGICGLRKGLEFVNCAPEEILSHENQLVSYAHEILSEVRGIRIYSRPENNAGLISFNLTGTDSNEAAKLLSDNGICVRSGIHCSPLAHKKLKTAETGIVRASFGYFNTKCEIEEMARILSNYSTARI